MASAAVETRIQVNDDGAWSWFQDERAIVLGNRLVVGSVAAGVNDSSRKGDVEVVTYDLNSGKATRVELHDRLERDDHDAPAFVQRSDGRVLAVYAKHGPENRFYYRITEEPGDTTAWGPVRSFVPSAASRITYANLFRLSDENGPTGRIYNFYRGLDNSFKPSYASSDDGGETWISGNVVIDVPTAFRHRPYVKYASDGKRRIHLFYTEGHPRRYDNSVYHVFYEEGTLHRSDGSAIRSLSDGLTNPEEGTPIFAGDADNVAWTSDIHLDDRGRPYVAFSVQKNRNHQDHRYHYARWTGDQWKAREIAHAGTRLYPGEDDYTGNIALDPRRPFRVFLSADVNPRDGTPLAHGHYQIFEGTSDDEGARWQWRALTDSANADNIRPIVPKGAENETILLWLQGEYRTYTDYDLDVIGLRLPDKNRSPDSQARTVYPAEEWARRTPLEAGLDAATLDRFKETVGGRGCVVRHGYLVYGWGDLSRRGDVASAAKPWYTHFLFKAVEDGRIESLQERVLPWEPRLGEINEALGHKDRLIEWRHMANQTSCYGLTDKPGTAFAYNDWQMALFWDTLFLKVYRTNYETVDAAVLQPVLTGPLQCQDQPTFMAFGTRDRPGRLAVSVRDFARFGLLYLRQGKWNGERLLSERHASMVTTSELSGDFPRTRGKPAEMIPGQRSIGSRRIPDDQTDHMGSYSWLWWTNGTDREGRRHWPDVPVDAYGAFGHGGPRAMVVIPSLDLIVSWNDAKVRGRSEENQALKLLCSSVVQQKDRSP